MKEAFTAAAAAPTARPAQDITRQPPQRPRRVLGRPNGARSSAGPSHPKALSTFTGDSLIYARGTHIGDAHSGSTLGIASFTSFANGDTRSGFVYADRHTTLTGFCERTITLRGATADFRQNFDLPLHRGWNRSWPTSRSRTPATSSRT